MRHAPQQLLVAQEDILPGTCVDLFKRRQGRGTLLEIFYVAAESLLELKHLGAVKFGKVAGEVPGHGGVARSRVPGLESGVNPRRETRNGARFQRAQTSTFVPTFRSKALR